MTRLVSPRGPTTLRRIIGRTFAILGVVVLILIAVVVVATVRFVSAGNSVVYRWQPAVARSEQVLSDLLDQETGLRGYALSREPSYLAPYEGARIAGRVDLDHLQSLVGSDAQPRADLAGLRAAAAQWQIRIAAPAVAQIGNGDPRGRELVQSRLAKQLFDDVRARAAQLATAVQARADAARRDRTTFAYVFVIAVALTGIMLTIAAFAVWRGLHRWVLQPVDTLGRQTRLVASGDTYRKIQPDGPLEFSGLGRDVEAMRLQIAGQLARAEEIQDELRIRSDELARSNDDLQQFAYVASHDLSEPLRKVANFCQLLERQYADKLDDRGRQYIDFAVDGAKRMQVLITDLLALSRVGRTTDQFTPVDLGRALDLVEATWSDRIQETGARIERLTPLPTVAGDRTLLNSLLENLVGNAIKYARAEVPAVVQVSAELDPAERIWTFTVSDNGIGIDAAFAERIFAVFQRLHLRDSYGGTGIGLALCRKIVEFHGGRIWLDTVESEGRPHGATFRFTLPEGAVLAESRD